MFVKRLYSLNQDCLFSPCTIYTRCQVSVPSRLGPLSHSQHTQPSATSIYCRRNSLGCQDYLKQAPRLILIIILIIRIISSIVRILHTMAQVHPTRISAKASWRMLLLAAAGVLLLTASHALAASEEQLNIYRRKHALRRHTAVNYLEDVDQRDLAERAKASLTCTSTLVSVSALGLPSRSDRLNRLTLLCYLFLSAILNSLASMWARWRA